MSGNLEGQGGVARSFNRKENSVKILEIIAEKTGRESSELQLSGFHLLVAVSQYNTVVTDRLLEGAMAVFQSREAEIATITLIRVPGALELPFVVGKAVASGRFDGALALGCVIRGETGHYDAVVAGVTQGLVGLNASGTMPVVFGILTTDTLLQALDRVGGKAGHKGEEGAVTLLAMARLSRTMGSGAKKKQNTAP